jgi:hypothetical protein
MKRGGEISWRFLWRHDPNRLRDWEPIEFKTPRLIARAVGRIIWHATISLTPLCHFRDAIDCIKKAAVFVDGKVAQWDAEGFSLEEKDIRALMSAYETARSASGWYSCQQKPVKLVIGVTDSSDTHYGSVNFEADGSVKETPVSLEWSEAMQELHIFCKETIAACWYIQKTARRNPYSTIVVGIDNTAAAFAIRRMYSSNKTVCKHLIDTHECLLSWRCEVRVVDVRSKQNAADPPSRPDEKWTEEEIKALQATCYQVICDELNGIRRTIRKPAERNDLETNLRHAEADEVEESEDEEDLWEGFESVMHDAEE